MISKSEKANPNYLAKVIKLSGLRKHANADRLQVITVDFQNVITGMDAKDGDIYVFFPVECVINKEFLSFTNSFRHKELNADKEQAGFFEDSARVKAMKLRGEKSMGYMVPVASVEKFTGKTISDHVGEEFDTIGEILMCKKYQIYVKPQYVREGKKPRISRIIEGQVRLHVDTENLRRNAFMIKPEDNITVSYKTHGTSWWVSHVMGKRKLNMIEKVLRALGVNIIDTEYDYFYGSRKVVKNCYETQNTNDYYDSDIWGDIKDEIKDKIPKGYTIYGEALGYTKTGQSIQAHYDYGCNSNNGEHRIQVYRITMTNPDGIVVDLSSDQVKDFCTRYGLEMVHVFYSGKAKDMYPELDIENHWHEGFIKNLERDYNEKECFMCVNKVAEEGIVVRKEGLFAFEAYKLKSFKFLEAESVALDAGVADMESANSEENA